MWNMNESREESKDETEQKSSVSMMATKKVDLTGRIRILFPEKQADTLLLWAII